MDEAEIAELLEQTTKLMDGESNTIIIEETKSNQEIRENKLFREIVTELNCSHMINYNYPNLKKLGDKYPELHDYTAAGLKGLFTKVNESLEKRGLPPYAVRFQRDDTLDPDFIASMNLILDTMDKRSIAAKLKYAGMTTSKFKALLKVKRYKEFYDQQIDKVFSEEVWGEAKLALARNVQEGDLSSIKYVGELENIFTPQRDFDPRILQVFMGSILDLVLKHVDPVKARLIAEEMETLAFQQLGMGNKPIEIKGKEV